MAANTQICILPTAGECSSKGHLSWEGGAVGEAGVLQELTATMDKAKQSSGKGSGTQ